MANRKDPTKDCPVHAGANSSWQRCCGNEQSYHASSSYGASGWHHLGFVRQLQLTLPRLETGPGQGCIRFCCKCTLRADCWVKCWLYDLTETKCINKPKRSKHKVACPDRVVAVQPCKKERNVGRAIGLRAGHPMKIYSTWLRPTILQVKARPVPTTDLIPQLTKRLNRNKHPDDLAWRGRRGSRHHERICQLQRTGTPGHSTCVSKLFRSPWVNSCLAGHAGLWDGANMRKAQSRLGTQLLISYA